MGYVDPRTVLSPKGLVSEVEIVFNTGPTANSWSVARLNWDGEPAVGVRWNGDDQAGVGTPQSRGNATWFIVPPELAAQVLEAAERLARQTDLTLASGYREMAADQEREADAQDWCEGLIGNATQER